MTANANEEQVLVIPRSGFEAAGFFQGFRAFEPEYQELLLSPENLSFRPRSLMEIDPSFKQLIPYVILKQGTRIFEYVRGSSGGEKRLHLRRSVGIGGHISSTDAIGDQDVYQTGMRRELNEEVEMPAQWTERPLGFIFDDRTPVGEVHLGIVHVIDLESPDVRAKEDSIAEGKFTELEELLTRADEFETWSQFALEAIRNEKSRA